MKQCEKGNNKTPSQRNQGIAHTQLETSNKYRKTQSANEIWPTG